jgi:hypothetical protein
MNSVLLDDASSKTSETVKYNRFYIPCFIFHSTRVLIEYRKAIDIAYMFKEARRDVLLLKFDPTATYSLDKDEATYAWRIQIDGVPHPFGYMIAPGLVRNEPLSAEDATLVHQNIVLLFQTAHAKGYDTLVLETLGASAQVAELFRREIFRTNGLFHTIVFATPHNDVYEQVFYKN